MATIKEISVEFGVTQNLGDYSNCKVSVRLSAELAEGEDPAQAYDELHRLARQQVGEKVDDELEAAGQEVKYHQGPLFVVQRNNARQCVVLAPKDAKLPEESNWQAARDIWDSTVYLAKMREARALMAFEKASAHLPDGYVAVDCRDGDFSKLPPLPDPGPEPVWHQKDLENVLLALGLPRERWEELASLEHVTREYLEELYGDLSWESIRQGEAEAIIRENRPLASKPVPEPDIEDDDGFDDEQDDEPF